MKEILLTEKEMVFLVLLYFHVKTDCSIYETVSSLVQTVLTSFQF